jgi:hypothetical protein
MARRLLLVLCVFALALSGAGSRVLAQETDDAKLIEQYNTAKENCEEPSLECLVFYTVNYVAIELTGSIVPTDGITAPPDDANVFSRGTNVAQQKGVVPAMSYFIGQMYANPAANTHVYVADLMNSANIAQPAYAQEGLGGLGFGSLSPILELWKIFRNIAYTFYVFLFIVIGFLIMFRRKVGQAAITAQQAIPSIVISLLFVTFSYAIAGLMIDLMYLSMYLTIGVFGEVFASHPDVINYNIFSLSWSFIQTGAIQGFNSGSNIVTDLVNNVLQTNNGGIADAFGWIGGITVGLVIAIAVLIGSFKLFFELLKSYASVVLAVVVGPIQLMMGAIPGNDPFMPWLKNLIANLAAFPTVLLVAVMFYVFTDGNQVESGGFMPPFLVGRGQADAISNIMGLAILLAMPEIVKEIKKKLGATEGFGAMVMNAAGGRAKDAWQGKGVPLGLGAKRIATIGAGTAGAVIGAPTGALIGGSVSKLRGRSFSSGAKTGALVGGGLPLAAPMVPGLLREGWKIGSNEIKDIISQETVDRGLHRLSQRQGKAAEIAGRAYATRAQNRATRQRRTTTDPVPPAAREAGDGY